MKLITYSLNNNLSKIELFCIKSWINQGYEVDLYTYSKNKYDLKINIKNPEKIIKKEDMDKIFIKKFKNFFFKIKLIYILGGIIIDPDIYCNKFYDFQDETLVSTNPDLNYSSSIVDLSIMKFPKKSKEMHYIVNHFFMLYNDFKNGYNTTFQINNILCKLLNNVFNLNKKEWNFCHSCNEEHWRSQLDIPFESENKSYLVDPKNLGNFCKIWEEKIIDSIPNFDINKFKKGLLGKLS